MTDVFEVAIQDNDSTAFEERADVARCPTCKELLNKFEEQFPDLYIDARRNYDISTTIDGIIVVSGKFIESYRKWRLSGLKFEQLKADNKFHLVKCNNVVDFDSERRGTSFTKKCKQCGRFKEVIGATPIVLKKGSSIQPRAFARTDLIFGGGDEKAYFLVCGHIAGEKLRESELKGVKLIALEE